MSVGIGVLAVAAWSGGRAIYLNGGLAEAKRLEREGRWEGVIDAASRYLRLWPADGEARLLLAEARLRAADAVRQPPGPAVAAALKDLRAIPDSVPQAAEARLRAARLTLLIQKRPAAAERLLREAIALDPDYFEAYFLLWRVLDLTRRSDEVEPVFREVIRLAPARQRAFHLRHWYLSQFAPASANLEFDRHLAILAPGEAPSLAKELYRYETFRRTEPESAMHVAAVAMLFVRSDNAKEALRVLKEAENPDTWSDADYLAARAEAAFALGDLEEVGRCVARWPETRHDFRYWKWHGIKCDEIDGDAAAALESYERSLGEWPGSLDWQLEFRRANCLRRLGRAEEAARAQARSAERERLTASERQAPLRRSLADLTDPDALEEIATFYESLERPWEARLWREHIAGLRRPPVIGASLKSEPPPAGEPISPSVSEETFP